MFLKAGALSLALLLASRLLGLVRESAQAAAFGTSGVADVVVLMLTLPDWLVGVLASGGAGLRAVAGVGRPDAAAQVPATERRVAWGLLAAGAVLALLLVLLRQPAVGWLAGGLPAALMPAAAAGPGVERAGVARRAAGRACGRPGCSTSATSPACTRPTWSSTSMLIAAIVAAGCSLRRTTPMPLAGRRAVVPRCCCDWPGCVGARPARRRRPTTAAAQRRDCRRAPVWLWAVLVGRLAAGLAVCGALDRVAGRRGRAGDVQLRLEAGRAAAGAGDPAGGDAGLPGHRQSTGQRRWPGATRTAVRSAIRTGLGLGLRRGGRAADRRAGHRQAAVRLGPDGTAGTGPGGAMGRAGRLGPVAAGADRCGAHGAGGVDGA